MKSSRFSIHGGQPETTPQALAPPGFVVCPIMIMPPSFVAWQQMCLYQAAYQQAQAEQKPRHLRQLFTCWN